MVMRLTPTARLARKMIRQWWNISRSCGNAEKPTSQTEVIMSLLTPIPTNGVTSEFGFEAPDIPRQTIDLRDHLTLVGRIYQVSGSGSADGHYCPFCYDSSGKFARMHRNAEHWQCCVCEAVLFP